jgi:hypothetical protein
MPERRAIAEFCGQRPLLWCGMKIAPTPTPDVACLTSLPRRRERLSHSGKCARLYFGAHLRMKTSHSLAKQVATRPVKKDEEIRVELDGEVVGRLPATFEIVPRALRVRFP